jgi:hypothetical protein
MISKKIIILIIALILLSAYIAIESWRTDYNPDLIENSSICLDYSSENNYAQYGTTCGPFSVAGTVRTIKQEEVDSWEFAENIKLKIGSFGTTPFGVKKQLKENEITIELPKVRGYSDEERIEFLQERLSKCSAIILLGVPEEINYQHYITVLGFDKEKDVFYIYDSFYHKINKTHTIDTNGDLPGNRNYSSEELINFWERGGFLGFYEWFSIVAN